MNIDVDLYIEQALKWRDEHLHHVNLMVSVAGCPYPPDSRDCMHPPLWKAESWKWLYERKSLPIPSPLLAVNTVEEYSNLPIELREENHWFWRKMYRRPYALVINLNDGVTREWDKFDEFVLENYPVQAFFREKVKDWISFKKFCLRERYWTVRNFFFPRQRWLTKQIRRDWQDKRTLAVDLLYMLVVHFVEGEKALDMVVYDDLPEHIEFKKGLLASYDWIKNGRGKLEKEMDIELTKATNLKGCKDYETRYGVYNALEKKLEDTNTETCMWIIKNRVFLWV